MVERSKAVKLTSFRQAGKASALYNSVVFFLTPEIAEARSVNYAEISDVRLPASILIWMGSPSRTFSLNAKFLARSQTEADVAFRNLNLLKSWCVTHSALGKDGAVTNFNQNDFIQKQDPKSPSDIDAVNAQDANTQTEADIEPKTFKTSGDLFKDTPEVLLLEGYGGQFRRIPVVITSLNITYPSDTDYIRNSKGVWVPILHDINISLKEAREITGANGSISSFSLKKFKEGTLEYW